MIAAFFISTKKGIKNGPLKQPVFIRSKHTARGAETRSIRQLLLRIQEKVRILTLSTRRVIFGPIKEEIEFLFELDI